MTEREEGREKGMGCTASLSAAEFFLRPSRFEITARETCRASGAR